MSPAGMYFRGQSYVRPGRLELWFFPLIGRLPASWPAQRLQAGPPTVNEVIDKALITTSLKNAGRSPGRCAAST